MKSGRRSLRNKITLIFLGSFLVLATLEIGLRAGGFLMLSLQEHENLRSIKQRGEFRILCLGESTTQRQYPPYLEEILNKRDLGVKISVIDKGLAGTNTLALLLQLEANLDKYQPDVVVTMMGCNDWMTMYYRDIPESNTWLFKHCRVYRFSRLLYMHILKKLKKEDIYSANKSTPAFKTPPSGSGRFPQTGQLLEETPELAFKKAIELDPENDTAYAGLGGLYRDQGKYAESESMLKKAIGLNPKNNEAYHELGRLYNYQKRYAEAEEVLQEAIRLDPKQGPVYVVLSWVYRDQGKLTEAEHILDRAVELNPEYDPAYAGLGQVYKTQKRLVEAEQAFKKAIELDPQNALAQGGLATIYGEMGEEGLSRAYADKLNNLSGECYNPVTVDNYRRLKKILDQRRVKLVCVQYPMRSLQSLKDIFPGEDVIFVDNERIFKDAVKKEGYNEYFRDMFAGDFGHCTTKGNRLLAGNIAGVIAKRIFRK